MEYPAVSTFSIVAYDPEKGDFGVAVASKFIAVGHIVPWAEVDVGAVATQSYVNASFGPKSLKLLKKGLKPKEVLNRILSNDRFMDMRQVGIVSRDGAYAYTGTRCMEWAGHIIGDNFAIQGNLLVGPQVVEEMVKAFENTNGELVDKLLAALKAGDKVGGDRRGKQSAAVYVVRKCGGYGGCEEGVGRYVDIRVDDHPEPVDEILRIFEIWELLLLERDDPSDIVKWDEVWMEIADALKKLGYLDRDAKGPDDEILHQAFDKWVGVNNFENKMRYDGYIWGSVYRYLMNSVGKRC